MSYNVARNDDDTNEFDALSNARRQIDSVGNWRLIFWTIKRLEDHLGLIAMVYARQRPSRRFRLTLSLALWVRQCILSRTRGVRSLHHFRWQDANRGLLSKLRRRISALVGSSPSTSVLWPQVVFAIESLLDRASDKELVGFVERSTFEWLVSTSGSGFSGSSAAAFLFARQGAITQFEELQGFVGPERALSQVFVSARQNRDCDVRSEIRNWLAMVLNLHGTSHRQWVWLDLDDSINKDAVIKCLEMSRIQETDSLSELVKRLLALRDRRVLNALLVINDNGVSHKHLEDVATLPGARVVFVHRNCIDQYLDVRCKDAYAHATRGLTQFVQHTRRVQAHAEGVAAGNTAAIAVKFEDLVMSETEQARVCRHVDLAVPQQNQLVKSFANIGLLSRSATEGALTRVRLRLMLS